MFGRLAVVFHVGCVLARNFDLPSNWSDDDEVAANIDDYNAYEDLDVYDDIKPVHHDNFTNSSNVTSTFRFIRELRNITRAAGDTVKMTCEVSATDSLQVDIKWFRNDAPVFAKRRGRVTVKYTERKQKKSHVSRLRIANLEVHDSGFYKCVATNGIQSKFSTGVLIVKASHTGHSTSNRDLPDFEPPIPNFETILKSSNINLINKNVNFNTMNSNPHLPEFIAGPILPYPICEPYKGTHCKKHLGDNNVFIPANVSQAMIEQKLASGFKVMSHSSDLSEHCATFALPTLCYSSLPVCRSTKPPKPELICREDCEMLENDICRVEYAIAKRHPVLGEIIRSSDCSRLPSTDCRSLGLPDPEPSDRSERCYRGDGREYRGEVTETITRKKCIPWNQSNIRTANYTELIGGHNFCRNPGLPYTRSRPWCYTYDNNAPVEEFCNIVECEDTRLQSAFIAIAGLAIVLFLILCYFCCSRRKSNRRKRDQMLTNKFNMSPGKGSIIKVKSASDCSTTGSRREMSSLIPNSTSSSQKSERRHVKVVEFSFSSIKFEEELGEGAFGKVYRGEVIVANNEKMLVAIKTLKENANSKTVGEFKREVELMSELGHPNIISLLGVCMTNRLCMLFEFMSEGDLHEYLISHSPHQDVPRNCSEPVLEPDDLLNIGIQIAAGMEYLCSQHFVHRDLATRNCLVGENLIVKISDFGLSRDVYSSDYYRVQKSALLPIRWMSPESILYGKFTVESDIWSYGVVLWEIYSYGLQPYYAHNNQDVVDMIRSHQVLSCPEGCPSRMYALMIECWNQVPSRRPQFAEIHSRLIQWRDTCSSSDKTDSTQLSHHLTHKPYLHHHLHSYPPVGHSLSVK